MVLSSLSFISLIEEDGASSLTVVVMATIDASPLLLLLLLSSLSLSLNDCSDNICDDDEDDGIIASSSPPPYRSANVRLYNFNNATKPDLTSSSDIAGMGWTEDDNMVCCLSSSMSLPSSSTLGLL